MGCHSLLRGDLPNPGVEPESPAWQADSLPLVPHGKVRGELENPVSVNSLLSFGELLVASMWWGQGSPLRLEPSLEPCHLGNTCAA